MQLFYKSLFCSFLVPFLVVTFMLLKLGFHFRQGWLPTSFAVKIIKELVAIWDFQTVLPKSEHSSNRKIRELILLQENGFLEEHQTLHARKHYNSHKWRTNTAQSSWADLDAQIRCRFLQLALKWRPRRCYFTNFYFVWVLSPQWIN